MPRHPRRALLRLAPVLAAILIGCSPFWVTDEEMGNPDPDEFNSEDWQVWEAASDAVPALLVGLWQPLKPEAVDYPDYFLFTADRSWKYGSYLSIEEDTADPTREGAFRKSGNTLYLHIRRLKGEEYIGQKLFELQIDGDEVIDRTRKTSSGEPIEIRFYKRR